MPTTPRRAPFARLAAEQFLRQSLHRRLSAVLLVAAHGAAGLDLPDDDRIHVVDLPVDIKPLGSKRNLCCALARSEWIAHWDDDDWRGDRYLDEAIEQATSDVFCRREAWFDDGRDAWLYRGGSLCGVGSTLLYRAEFWRTHQFPALQIGEDNAFIRGAAERAVFGSCSDQFVARDHGANTSGRMRDCPLWSRHGRSALPREYLTYEAQSGLL